MTATTLDAPIFKKNEAGIFTVPTFDFSTGLTYQGQAVIDGLTDPQGDLTPITAPDNSVPNKFNIIDVIRAAPDLGELTILERWPQGRQTIAQRLKGNDCPWLFYVKLSGCARPDVFSDWQAMLVVWQAQLTEVDWGGYRSFDENADVQITGTMAHQGVYVIDPIRLTPKAESIVLAEVLDVIYADKQSCGTCTPYSAGCNMKFALTKANASSAGLSGQIVFTKNGTTYDSDDINSLAGGNGTSLQAVGQYLVVTQSSTARHHWAIKSEVTDSPDTYNWTAVSSGYQSSGGGTCSVAGATARLYVGGLAGYIYATDDITVSVTEIHSADLTANDFFAIQFAGGNLLAVGESNTILLSTNAYNSLAQISFSSITGPSALTGVDLTACWIWNATNFMVGGANGELWFTVDGGSSWTQRTLPSMPTGTISRINDIQFAPDAPFAGAMAVQTATRGYVLRTLDGGRSWQYSAPAITQISGITVEKYNAVALCGANAILAGGLKASSTDGALGEAT